MKLDRLLFLSLATSLSAVACSSAEPTSDVDEGAASIQRCKDPGATSARIVDTHVTFCAGFAERAQAKGDQFASVYGQCMTYATRYKSAAASAAISCLKDGETRADTWDNLYGCGFSALTAHCANMEGFTPKCRDLVQVANQSRWGNYTRSGKKDDTSLVNECIGLLGGLDADAVAEVEACVRGANFSVYSCVEGLDASPKGRICVDTTVHQAVPGLKDTCDRLLNVSSADEGILNRDTCLGIGTRLYSASTAPFLESLTASIEAAESGGKKIGNYDVTQIASRVIRDACHTTAVDAACGELVTAAKSSGISNNGGRLTKDCHQLFSALDAKGRDQVRVCSGFQQKLSRAIAGGAPEESLFWCLSDLKAYPSEL